MNRVNAGAWAIEDRRITFSLEVETGRPVLEDFRQRIPATLELTLASLVVLLCSAAPLRAQVDSKKKFSAFLRELRTTMLDAYDHQRLTFGSLIKRLQIARDPGRLPLVSVLFNVDQAVSGDALAFDGLKVQLVFSCYTWFTS